MDDRLRQIANDPKSYAQNMVVTGNRYQNQTTSQVQSDYITLDACK